MRLLHYGLDNLIFLSDAQFARAAPAWASGKNVYLEELGLYLPVSRNPAGLPEEHRGLEIAWSREWRCWIARQTLHADDRPIVYVREEAEDGDRRYWYWRRINPNDTGDRSGRYDDYDKADADGFWLRQKPMAVDDALNDKVMRDQLPFHWLTPKNLVR